MLKRYDKNSEISYSLGVSPTIELLKNKKEAVTQVILNPKGAANSGVAEILKLCKDLQIPVEENQKLIEKLSSNENTYALGVYKKYSSLVSENANHLVLVEPSDMGNLGTICRTMLAFGFKDLAIVRPAVDIFDPKVARASMGAVFHLNFEYFEDFESYSKKYSQKSNRHVYTFMTDGANPAGECVFERPLSLVFGNEGKGLDASFKRVGKSVKIPISGDVDSLNLAIAVGISLYEVSNGRKVV